MEKTIKAGRLLHIEMAARRLGMSSVIDARERVGYMPPSVEEDMQQVNLHVFGTPERQEMVYD